MRSRLGVFRHLVTAAVFLLPSCAAVPSDLLLPSIEADQKLGQEVSKKVQEEMGIVEDAGLSSFVSGLGQRLATQIQNRQFAYSFQIVDQAEPNAFAVPGGHVYVSRGLLALVNTEEELAGVLGHEIVHVERRHTARQLQKARLPSLLTLPGRAAGWVIGGELGEIVSSPFEAVGAAYLSAYSRQDEIEADEIGQAIAARAGYDPRALATILDRLERFDRLQTGTERGFSFFATHPTTPTRVSEITEQAKGISWTRRPGLVASGAEVLRRLDGLVLGENPANGIFRGQQFLHPDLDFSIQFPPKWKTMNTRRLVGAVAPDEDALAFLGLRGKGTDPSQPAQAFVQAVQREFGIKPTRSERVQIGQWHGHVVTLTDTSGGKPVHMHFLWIAARGLIYQMVGVAPDRYREVLRQAAQSFRPLTSAERASITEMRLRVVAAREGETLTQLSRRTQNQWKPETTAVVNGIQPLATLRQGQLVKIAVKQSYR
ncbi:MAG: M48 family metalloprotease [Candidatus Methylomirabilota bacterium]